MELEEAYYYNGEEKKSSVKVLQKKRKRRKRMVDDGAIDEEAEKLRNQIFDEYDEEEGSRQSEVGLDDLEMEIINDCSLIEPSLDLAKVDDD